MPSVDDEKNTYRDWGWSWATDKEPSAVTEPIVSYSVANPDIHGDTEGDDLWTYLMMYRRSGNQIYLNRAQAWAGYYKTKYRTSPEFSVDDGFLLDHMYGWGLVTWYEHTCQTGTCDTAALTEAENLAAVSEAHWSTRSNKTYPVAGQFRMGYYSVREGARHLLLATRVAEVTKNPRWIALRDRLIELWLQSPDWDARGMYFFGDYETDNYLGAGSYAAGARIVSPFQIGILSEAFDQAYRTTGRAALRDRLVAMARFVSQYGLDPGCQYTGYRFGIRNGQPWHSYTDGNTSSCTAGFWDSAYSTSLVNTLVRGYKYSGDASLYERAKYFFNRGTKGIYGNPATRSASDTVVHHFVDTRFDSSSGNFYMNFNKGELQYTYLLFEYPHPSSTVRAACAGDIANMAPGTWCSVANSHMRDVAYKWPAGVTYTGNGIGVEGVMDLWSGGAYDTRRDRLMVWGGGHNGYGGNEIYAFDVNTLRWGRLYDPVTPSRCVAEYSDGSPASSHSYGFVEYLANVDRFAAFETGAWCEQGIGFLAAHAYNPANASWERWPDSPVGDYAQSAYDPVTGHAWMKGNSGQCYVAEFDPLAKKWQIRSDFEGCYAYYPTMVVDHDRRLLIAIGEGKQWAWDISKPGTLTRIDIGSTGDQTIVNTSAPGLAYDSVSKKVVGWQGGADVYTLDTKTWHWTKQAPVAANAVIPTAPNPRGTFGRFRYIPSKNAFIVVNQVDENVYFYKLPAGIGIAASAASAASAKPSIR